MPNDKTQTKKPKSRGEQLAAKLIPYIRHRVDSAGHVCVWISDEGKNLIVRTIDEACGESYMEGVRHEQKQ